MIMGVRTCIVEEAWARVPAYGGRWADRNGVALLQERDSNGQPAGVELRGRGSLLFMVALVYTSLLSLRDLSEAELRDVLVRL